MAKIKIDASTTGTGTFTISAPNSNTDRTLTLPDTTSSLLTTSYTGDVNFSSGTLFVDQSTSRVGIGVENPLRKLHVAGTFACNASASQYYGVYINGAGEGNDPSILIGDWHNASAILKYDSTARAFSIDTQYSSGAGTFKITGNDGASEFMRIDSSGNVGIGTTSPQTILHIEELNNSAGDVWTAVGSGNVPSLTIQNSSTTDNNNAAIFFRDNDGMRASIGARFVNHTTNETELRLSTTDSSGTTRERVTIDGSGNVGIGTNSPARALHIEGSNNTTSSLRVSNTAVSGGNYWDFVPQYNASDLAISNNGTERMRLSDTEASWTNTTSGFYNRIYGPTSGDISSGYLTYNGSTLRGGFYTNPSHGLTIISDVDITLRANNANRMHIDTSGRVTMPYQPSFNAYRSTSQAVSGQTTLVFDTTLHNIGSHYNTSSGAFTAPVDGAYVFNFKALLYSMGTNEIFDFYPQVNGVNRHRYELSGNGGNHVQFDYSEVVYLNANDTFRMTGSDRSNASYSMYGNENHFSGHLLG